MSDEKDPRLAQEIKKLPRSRCALCGLEGVKPMVNNGRCVNERACQLRRERNAGRKQQREGKRE